jgi:hypothetical protein
VNGELVYSVLLKNNSAYSLNGTQIRLTLPSTVACTGAQVPMSTQGADLVATVGRLAAGTSVTVHFKTVVDPTVKRGTELFAAAAVTSGTAMPVSSNSVVTSVVRK